MADWNVQGWTVYGPLGDRENGFVYQLIMSNEMQYFSGMTPHLALMKLVTYAQQQERKVVTP